MKDLELRRFDMFKEARIFTTSHQDFFLAGTYNGDLQNGLTLLLTAVENHFKSQSTQRHNAKGGTIGKAAAREALYVELKAISRTASIIDRDIPGVEEKFFLPNRVKEQELLNLAGTFAEIAAQYEKDFLQHGMDADFLAHLAAHIDAFKTALEVSSQTGQAQAAETAAIDAWVERGMDLVDRINVVIINKYHNDKEVMKAWNAAKHVPRARSTSKKPAPVPEPAPEPAASESKSVEPSRSES